MEGLNSVPLVLMTIGRLNIGGAERRLLQLSQWLHDNRVPVNIALFVVSGRSGVLDEDFRRAGCEIFYGQPGPAGLVQLAKVCRRIEPDVLHANSGTAGGFYCMVAKAVGVSRVISHIRSAGPSNSSGMGKHGMIYEPLTGLFSDLVIGVSQAALDGKRFGRARLKVVYNGLDPKEVKAIKSSRPPLHYEGPGPDIVLLGRLDRLKNIPHAISSFGRFVKLHGDNAGRLHVVGPDGNVSAAELKEFARGIGVEEDRVIFHGPTSEPLRFFYHADCALLPSDYEGLPGAALEALSCGTPLVASDIASNREIMRLCEGVEVIPVSDIDGWVAAMSRALERDRRVICEHFWNKGPFSLFQHANGMLAAWGMPPINER